MVGGVGEKLHEWVVVIGIVIRRTSLCMLSVTQQKFPHSQLQLG